MAKTLRTSGDYTVKAGAGYDSGSGSNTIRLDARYVRIPGDLTVDGTQTVVNSETLTIEDQFIETNRNNSTAGTEDSGIFFNQGSSNHALFYYDAGNGEFQLGTTTQDASANPITDITLGHLKVATTPTDSNHAASKDYVDTEIAASAGGMTSFDIVGDDSTGASVTDGQDIKFTSDANLTAVIVGGSTHTITYSLTNNLTDIHSITNSSTNADLTLSANSNGSVVINDILTFSGPASTPSADTVTKLYNKTPAGGGTGLYFINSQVSATEGELISKKKATALAIALG